MNELKIFTNTEFGELGAMEIDGKTYFPATDCARMLGYANPRDAIARHCRGCVKHDGVTMTKNQHGTETAQTVEMNFIPEGDLYRLITQSHLPEAERFEHWIFDEVIPSIRKHGLYATDATVDNILADPDFGIRLLTQYKAERAARMDLEAQTALDRPKVLFADSVAASEQSILIGELAKILNQNGLDIGQNRLFDQLRTDGYLCSHGERRNLPSQRSMDMGLFEIKERIVNNHDGSIRLTLTTKVTGKGQIYFVNRYAGRDAVGS